MFTSSQQSSTHKPFRLSNSISSLLTTEKSEPKRLRKLPEPSSHPTEGYSCTLYKDYLVFYGGRYEDKIINEPCVYNLKTKELEINRVIDGGNAEKARFDHSACAYEQEGMIVFFGGRSDINTNQTSRKNSVLKIEIYGKDNIQWYVLDGPNGSQPLPSPISNVYKNTLYLYQAGTADCNFGSLDSYQFDKRVWCDYEGANRDLRLFNQNDCAIFCDDDLYLFAENQNHTEYKRNQSIKIFEDVYVHPLGNLFF